MARRERQIPRARRPRRHRASGQGPVRDETRRTRAPTSGASRRAWTRPLAELLHGDRLAARRDRCQDGSSAGNRPGRRCACSRSTAEQPTPQRPPFPAPEGFVFATSLPGNPVDVVLGVSGRRASRSCGRQMSEVWVLGACATFLTHARRYALCKRCTSRSQRSPACAHLLARREGVEPPTF
jgi:hypothetical protein